MTTLCKRKRITIKLKKMDNKKEITILLAILAFFLLAYYLPVGEARFDNAVIQSLELAKWYAREHVLLCLIPAFFIAGVISIFVSQSAVLKYFGAKAVKWKAYLVASVSGSVLAVCSCTILPLFSSIHKRGAGLGPAIAFLYSGPAINILAIILTARILGWELGVARTIGAVVFSIAIGLAMAFIFRKEEAEKAIDQLDIKALPNERPLWQTSLHFFALVFILVFANWGKPSAEDGVLYWLWANKWYIASVFGIAFFYSLIYIVKVKLWHAVVAGVLTIAAMLLFGENPLLPFTVAFTSVSVILFLNEGEPREWLLSSWGFAKQIMPLLGAGVLAAGLLLGTPEGEGVIPQEWVAALVGGNSIGANLFASVFGAFMYFATLTEVPIIQGLIASGMGKGPALALLLAGPALSLPNMLVIRSVMGTKKTLIFVILVIIMATISGLFFGSLE